MQKTLHHTFLSSARWRWVRAALVSASLGLVVFGALNFAAWKMPPIYDLRPTLYLDEGAAATWVEYPYRGVQMISLDFGTQEEPVGLDCYRMGLDGRRDRGVMNRLAALERRTIPTGVRSQLWLHGSGNQGFGNRSRIDFVAIGFPYPWLYYGLTEAERAGNGPLPHQDPNPDWYGLRHRVCVFWGRAIAGWATLTGLLLVPWMGFRAGVRLVRRRRHLCGQCGYDLANLASDRCPECGVELAGRVK